MSGGAVVHVGSSIGVPLPGGTLLVMGVKRQPVASVAWCSKHVAMLTTGSLQQGEPAQFVPWRPNEAAVTVRPGIYKLRLCDDEELCRRIIDSAGVLPSH